jgi:transposase
MVQYVGMDVHKETISVAVLHEESPAVVFEKTLRNDPGSLRIFFKRLKEKGMVAAAYEAGCMGFQLQRFFETELQIPCTIVAPGKIPKKPGEHIKTDKRDAILIAKLLRADEAVCIHVPSGKDEAVKDYLRARDDLRIDLARSRRRLLSFLLRRGFIYDGGTNWTMRHERWLKEVAFEDEVSRMVRDEYFLKIKDLEERLRGMDERIGKLAEDDAYRERVGALRCFKGIDTLTALALVCEVADFHRFRNAEAFMSFLGLVPKEHSSGDSRRQGGLTKAGNGHLRRLLTESSWHYRIKSPVGKALAARRVGQPAVNIAYANKALARLQKKFSRLILRGKNPKTAVSAVSRELAGFVWGMMSGHMI